MLSIEEYNSVQAEVVAIPAEFNAASFQEVPGYLNQVYWWAYVHQIGRAHV